MQAKHRVCVTFTTCANQLDEDSIMILQHDMLDVGENIEQHFSSESVSYSLTQASLSPPESSHTGDKTRRISVNNSNAFGGATMIEKIPWTSRS